jgi:2-dehydro-3-deoxyglucarate aldolase
MTDPFRNPLKKKLSQGCPCIGAWLTSGAAITAEAMATLGFDWLCVDMEHGSSDISQVEAVFMAVERHGVAPMVRIGTMNGDLARRLLDLGAVGIIVAAVEDAEAFEDFARYCLYAPAGYRGVGLSRCNRWGDDFEDYKDNFSPLMVPMVETRRGVDAAVQLAALPMVDALFIGPYDLSSDLSCGGDFQAPVFTSAVESVRMACGGTNKALGIHQVKPDVGELQGRIDDGFTLLAYGTDVIAMRHALSSVRDIKGTKK